MLTMLDIIKIRYMHKVDKKSIKKISKELGVARNSVRRCIKDDLIENKYVKELKKDTLIVSHQDTILKLLYYFLN